MGWLVHHEFGLDHLPFEWELEALTDMDSTTIDYWLIRWICTYRYLLDSIEKTNCSIVFVSYERLCSNHDGTWQSLSELLKLPAKPPIKFINKNSPVSESKNLILYKNSLNIYEELIKRSDMALKL